MSEVPLYIHICICRISYVRDSLSEGESYAEIVALCRQEEDDKVVPRLALSDWGVQSHLRGDDRQTFSSIYECQLLKVYSGTSEQGTLWGNGFVPCREVVPIWEVK